MFDFVSRFINENSGATAIEYSLIAAGIALAIIVAVNTLGSTVLIGQFQVVKNAISP
jgi:pilus assembly protein Flp/PilA